MLLVELTPGFAIRSDHDSFLPGIIFQKPIMTYIQPLVKMQLIERFHKKEQGDNQKNDPK